MNTNIPVFSSTSTFDRMATEHEARAMLAAGTHDLVRDRAGKCRRLYEREHVEQPLSPSAKRQAMASYSGTVKFTYREGVGFERPAHIHMLKKYIPKTGEFVRW